MVHPSRRALRRSSAALVLLIFAGPGIATAQISVQANPGTVGPIPDGPVSVCQNAGAPRDVTFTVAGVQGTVQTVEVTITLTHSFVGDVVARLIAPNGTGHDLFGYTGATASSQAGDNSNLGGTYTFTDSTSGLWWSAAQFVGPSTPLSSGSYRTSARGGSLVPGAPTSMNAAFYTVAPNGTWTLRLTDGCSGDTGSASIPAILTIGTTVNLGAQPPSSLRTASIVGNLVTLRWKPPVQGLPPNEYIVEGGVAPSQVLGSLPTGRTHPILTFTAPTGAFYVRVHAVAGGVKSGPSNEIRLFVNVPEPPSPPTNLLRLVNGSTLTLAWRNGFAGGAPQALMLDVSGSATASLGLGLTDHVTFSGVPPGTYNLRVRAANGAGTSGPSNQVTVTVPGPCTGVPQAPDNFIAYKLGNAIFVEWDPFSFGPAPTGYLLDVTGSFVGSFPITDRKISGSVGPGTYFLRARSTNACGISPSTTDTVKITIP